MKRLLVCVAMLAAISIWLAFATTAGGAAAQGGDRLGTPEPGESASRPPVMGTAGAVSAGHPLTTAAALEILLRGGNAFDAGVASLLVGGVVEQDLYSLGGEALVLVYPEREKRVISVVGQGWAPKAATIEWYRSRNKTLQGAGLDPAVVPGALHAALTVLERWGTLTFEEVSARAIAYAERGFPLRPRTATSIESNLEFFEAWPANQRYWLKPDGSPYAPGETIALPTLADTLTKMVEAEREHRAGGRAAGVAAARDRFYRGDIARRMVAFLQQHGAPFDESDFGEFFAKIEEPTASTYKEYTIYKHGFGSQGPMLLQTLNMLEQFDLRALRHNSPDYVHTVIEAMKLAYADRDSYYGDPEFVQVPAEGLLSKAYAKERAARIDAGRASRAFVAGNPLPFDSTVRTWPYWVANVNEPETARQAPVGALMADDGIDADGGIYKDTTHMAIVDRDGNIFDATPSGGWIGGAVVLGDTGIAMSVRGEQFWLDEDRAAQLRPRSRPRYTLTPSIIARDGQPFMALGTPGGDNQEQIILQAFLNVVEFWDQWYPNLHAAFEWPRFQTLHFYGSFWPHSPGFNRMNIESTVPEAVVEALKARGHAVTTARPFSISGCATAVMIDPATGNRLAAADPRRDCYAIAY